MSWVGWVVLVSFLGGGALWRRRKKALQQAEAHAPEAPSQAPDPASGASWSLYVAYATEPLATTPWEALPPTSVLAPLSKLQGIEQISRCEGEEAQLQSISNKLHADPSLLALWSQPPGTLLPPPTEEHTPVPSVPLPIPPTKDKALREVLLYWPMQINAITQRLNDNRLTDKAQGLFVAAVVAQMLCELLYLEQQELRDIKPYSRAIQAMLISLGEIGQVGHLALLDEWSSCFKVAQSSPYAQGASLELALADATIALRERANQMPQNEAKAQYKRVQEGVDMIRERIGARRFGEAGQLSLVEWTDGGGLSLATNQVGALAVSLDTNNDTTDTLS